MLCGEGENASVGGPYRRRPLSCVLTGAHQLVRAAKQVPVTGGWCPCGCCVIDSINNSAVTLTNKEYPHGFVGDSIASDVEYVCPR